MGAAVPGPVSPVLPAACSCGPAAVWA
jgi:hypothetical protein